MKETGASVVALSGFLTLAYDSMKNTIEAMTKAGLRDKVQVMIGGGQITEEVKKIHSAPMLLAKMPWSVWLWLRNGLELE